MVFNPEKNWRLNLKCIPIIEWIFRFTTVLFQPFTGQELVPYLSSWKYAVEAIKEIVGIQNIVFLIATQN